MSPLATTSFGDFLSNSASNLVKRATYTLNDDSSDSYSYQYSSWTRNFVIAYTIILAGLLLFSALGALVALVVWYFREQRRKRWYGPMAQYYRERGFGRTGFVQFNGATYVPQVVYVPAGSQPGVPQPPPGPIVGIPTQYPQGQAMNPGNQPQLQPINTSIAYTRSPGNGQGSGIGNDGTADIAAGITERDIEGPTSPIRDFNGASAHDPFAPPRFQPYPPLQSQAQQESSHGISEVNGTHVMREAQDMSERGDVGLTRTSLYSVPTGSHPNPNTTGAAAAGRC